MEESSPALVTPGEPQTPSRPAVTPLDDDGSRAASKAVQRCVDAIRGRILFGELLPGQQLRQAQLAEEMQVSRIPIREALGILRSERILTYTSNTGYFVSRFGTEELNQIYRMRRLVEGEVLGGLSDGVCDLVDALTAMNDEYAELLAKGDIPAAMSSNRRFHFAIFSASPDALIVEEAGRLWNMSDVYRSLYLHEGESRRQVVADHTRMIRAIAAHDLDELVRVSDEHRSHAEQLLTRAMTQRRAYAASAGRATANAASP